MTTITAIRQTAICCIFTAALVVGCSTAAEAQTRSRIDLEFGGGFVAGRPNYVLGATVWSKDNGLAVRGVFQSAFGPQDPDLHGIEAMYYRRGIVENVEIDFGIGMRFMQETSTLLTGEAMELLVGRRFLHRFGVKAGLGCRSWLSAGGEAITWAARFMVVVPLGEQ